MHVFGDGAGSEAANLLQRRTAKHGRTATVEGRVEAVLAGLQDVEEKLLLLPADPRPPVHLVLEGIEVVEVLRGLHNRGVFVAEEADHLLDQVGTGNMIGVQRDDELAGCMLQAVVEISGLGVSSFGAGEIPATELLRKLLHRRTIAVVEDVGLVRIAHHGGAQHGFAQQFDGLVVGGDEDIHRPPSQRTGYGMARRRPRRNVEQESFQEVQGLGHDECIEKPSCRRIHGRGGAPEEVPRGEDHGEHNRYPGNSKLDLAESRNP